MSSVLRRKPFSRNGVPADEDVAHALFVQALEQAQQGIQARGHQP